MSSKSYLINEIKLFFLSYGVQDGKTKIIDAIKMYPVVFKRSFMEDSFSLILSRWGLRHSLFGIPLEISCEM